MNFVALSTSIYLIFVALSWVWLLFHYRRRIAVEPKVTPIPGEPHWGEEPPLVTLVLPCRNEAEMVEECVRSLCGQDYPHLQVVAVDDSSEDNTRGIILNLQEDYENLELVDAGDLPQGWTGKNHALYRGVQKAVGAWLLFTDADTVHEAGCLRISLRYALERGIDLLSISPPQECETFWEGVVQPVVFSLLSRLFPLDRVNSPGHPEAAANGQFILIRRSVYGAVGGHEAVRGEVLEDVHLARLVKERGFRIHLALAPDLLRTRMYTSFGEMWEGWTKNLYPLHGGEMRRLTWSAASLAIFALLPALILLFSLPLDLGDGGERVMDLLVVADFSAIAAMSGAGGLTLRLYQYKARFAPFIPLGAAVVLGMLIRSTYDYRIRGGIRWKGRNYPT